jgi:regulator of sigma E protease
MDILIQASQFLLSLSLLIVLHEFGHFVPARLFGTRVEKFYLFFDYKWSLFKKKIGDTEWGIGWIPLGGYVKIAGMIDESMDKEQMAGPPQPWEFRSKPAWQRLIIMLGGVTVNVILGFLIYVMLMWVYGEQKLPNSSVKDGIMIMNPVAGEMGFKDGDKILTVRGEEVPYFRGLTEEIIYGGDVTIERDGEVQTITIPVDLIGELSKQKTPSGFFYPRVPFIIAAASDTSLNKGLFQAKDKVLAIDGKTISYFDEVKDILAEKAGGQVQVALTREDKNLTVDAKVSNKGLLEVVPLLMSFDEMEKTGFYEFQTLEYDFLSSWPAGWSKTINKVKSYVRQFSLIFNPDTGAWKSLGGFMAIGGLFQPEWDWQAFWNITAFLSLILAVMNLLPIPALDGGHVMFLLYEMVTGREPNQKFLEFAQLLGFLILIALLLFANGNDVYRKFF